MRLRPCSGFTFIEVLVALAIVGLSLTAIAASTSQMIDASNTMRERTYASWIAQNRISEFRLASQAPKVSTSSGEVEYANADWTWRAVVSETGVEELYRIDVSVSLAGSDDVIRTVTGFVGTPGTPGGANQILLSGGQSSGAPQQPSVGPDRPDR